MDQQGQQRAVTSVKTVAKVEWAYFHTEATTSLNMLHILYLNYFSSSKDKYTDPI